MGGVRRRLRGGVEVPLLDPQLGLLDVIVGHVDLLDELLAHGADAAVAKGQAGDLVDFECQEDLKNMMIAGILE